MKKIITLCLILTFVMSMPVAAYTNTAIEIIEPEFQTVSITANNSKLHIVGGNTQTLKIYNVAGVCVLDIRVDNNDKYYDLNLPKGCYIVKVGKVVRKIYIK